MASFRPDTREPLAQRRLQVGDGKLSTLSFEFRHDMDALNQGKTEEMGLETPFLAPPFLAPCCSYSRAGELNNSGKRNAL